ncbi:queuosine precursor transporter [Methanolapillus millepedarum]|uniref:Probable queuosine precursor transporter n=1 Tax=Methanolapillus millepedarum TaxID=3028296 RepID=A0AA96ZUP7_9EURY|nr:queuosine precursor transporter [Methanosarcinaceae archaeon Ac7]
MDYTVLYIILFWLITMTVVTLVSVRIVKKYPVYGFVALTAFYVTYLLSSQVIATRISVYDLGTWFGYSFVLAAPTAAIIYPFISQVLDMINEVYGKKRAVTAITIALLTQVLYVMFVAMAVKIPAAPFYELNDAWLSIFGLSVGIVFASWISFLVCSILDTYMFSYIKQKLRPRELAFKGDTFFNPYIWIRSLLTDVVSLALDSVIFVFIAFYLIGGMPLDVVIGLIVGQMIVKVLVGAVDTPWFVLYKRMLGNTDYSKELKQNEP